MYSFFNQNFLPMVKQDLLTQSKGIPVFRNSLLSLLFIFLLTSNGFGQSQIVCNDNVQVSLDGDCQAVIRPDMILEGPILQYAPPFRIRISGAGIINNNTNAPIVTNPGNYTVTVTNSTGNSCWGNMKVEDKLGPVVDCECPEGNDDPDCELLCTDEAGFFAGTYTDYPKPIAEDACTTVTTQFSDEIIVHGVNGCGGKTILRTWIFTDAYGNKNETCVSEYRILPADLADVELAAPYNAPQLTCAADVSMTGVYNFYKAKLYAEYLPSYLALVPGTYSTVKKAEAAAEAAASAEAYRYAYPTINGKPINGNVCNLLAAKSDTEIPVCNAACSNSKKVIRLWTVLDWCSSGTRTFTQIIKATDEENPTVTAPDVTVSVDPWSCTANFLMPLPTVLHDNCDANPKYRVEVPFGVSVKWDAPSNRFLVTGAPKGQHAFTYIATDCCGHEGRYDVVVTVIDKTAPVAIAKQHIVISLTTGGENDGIAKIFANSVDNGSYDSCTPVHIELRREDNPNRDNDGCGYTGNKTYNADGHPNDGSTNPSAADYDPDNGEYVKFCCDDITNTEGAVPYGIVKVWMRVWDDGDMDGVFGTAGDNYNETWVDVRVEDKLTPQIVCPPNVTIDCDDDRNDLTVTGSARAFSNCLDLETEYTDRNFLNNCNVGYVERTWRIKSKPSIICTQYIHLRNVEGEFTESDITWPADVTTDCANDAALQKPTWTAGPCDIIGLSLKSDTFYFEGNACMKILNKWTIINWCSYDPNATDPTGYFSHVQVVKIIDEQKPTLASCADRMFEIDDHGDADSDGNRCETKNLMLTMSATDQGQCASDWLKWIVFVDLWADGVNDYEYSTFLPSTDVNFNDSNGNGIKDRYVAATGQGGEVKVTIPEDIQGSMSNHKVTWKVVDGCGNVTACTQNFMVVDKKKPTPYCLNISSALMQNGKVELWAVDFNIGSFDNCTTKGNLLYTFNEASPVPSKINTQHYFKANGQNATEAEYNAGNAQKWLPGTKSSGMIFDCDDLPSVDVKMTVWDEKGNYDFCVVTLELADNQGACGTQATTTVSGKLITSGGETVSNAEIALDNGIKEMLQSTVSTTAGEFNFAYAKMYYNYTVTGKKTDDYLNGVSTLDLVLIQRHLLDLSRLTSPFNIIAADINNDNKVTASDLVELRKLILGIYTELPNNGSWRFLNSNTPFADASNPFPFNERVEISNLSHAMANQNFTSVKIGDVNGSATGNLDNKSTDTRSAVVLNTTNGPLTAKEIQAITFDADINEVYGMQFTLTVNNADLADIYVGNTKLEDTNIAKISDNTYTVSWNDINAVSGKELLTIHVVPNANTNVSDVISISSNVTSAEVYSGETLSTGKLSLRFAGTENNAFALYQNEPNPFTDKTTISFYLPEAGDATLKVFDVNGKMIYTNKGSFGKGINSFNLSKNDFASRGVMIYQVENGANTATKKMIGLE